MKIIIPIYPEKIKSGNAHKSTLMESAKHLRRIIIL